MSDKTHNTTLSFETIGHVFNHHWEQSARGPCGTGLGLEVIALV